MTSPKASMPNEEHIHTPLTAQPAWVQEKPLLELYEHAKDMYGVGKESLRSVRSRGRLVLAANPALIAFAGILITREYRFTGFLRQGVAHFLNAIVNPATALPIVFIATGSVLFAISVILLMAATFEYLVHREDRSGMLQAHSSFASTADAWPSVQPKTTSVSATLLFTRTMNALGYGWIARRKWRQAALHVSLSADHGERHRGVFLRLVDRLCFDVDFDRFSTKPGVTPGSSMLRAQAIEALAIADLLVEVTGVDRHPDRLGLRPSPPRISLRQIRETIDRCRNNGITSERLRHAAAAFCEEREPFKHLDRRISPRRLKTEIPFGCHGSSFSIRNAAADDKARHTNDMTEDHVGNEARHSYLTIVEIRNILSSIDLLSPASEFPDAVGERGDKDSIRQLCQTPDRTLRGLFCTKKLLFPSRLIFATGTTRFDPAIPNFMIQGSSFYLQLSEPFLRHHFQMGGEAGFITGSIPERRRETLSNLKETVAVKLMQGPDPEGSQNALVQMRMRMFFSTYFAAQELRSKVWNTLELVRRSESSLRTGFLLGILAFAFATIGNFFLPDSNTAATKTANIEQGSSASEKVASETPSSKFRPRW